MKSFIFFNKLFQLLGLVSLLALFYYSINYSAWWLLVSFLYYKFVVGLVGTQIAHHRYFSHNSFKTSKFKHKLLVWISLTTGISAVLYASFHRYHHVHSDTDNDFHSPRHSIIKSLFTWSNNFKSLKKVKPALDLLKDPTILYVHKYGHYFLLVLIILFLFIEWKFSIFVILAGMGWNHLHMNLFRTTLVHLKLPGSYRNFDTTDQSWNNKIIQILDIGEGLHNNHHKYPNRYDEAVLPNEFDPAAWVVRNFFEVVDNK
jgi:stearoyl-CoA desaturase (delta-9 desaturase)